MCKGKKAQRVHHGDVQLQGEDFRDAHKGGDHKAVLEAQNLRKNNVTLLVSIVCVCKAVASRELYT